MPTFTLSKTDHRKIAAAAKRLEKPASALLAALAKYNDVLGELRELVRRVETDWQAAWDKRSERWQESAAGQSVFEAITAWNTLADDLEEIQLDFPNIEIPKTN
jgi:hypothetical protein